MKPPTTIYAGKRLKPTGDVNVTVDGQKLAPNPSQKLFNHSPDGFNWGYAGTGPAQLALAILFDYYDDAELAVRLHQSFKFAVIARLPENDDWVIHGAEIERTVAVLERAQRERRERGQHQHD